MGKPFYVFPLNWSIVAPGKYSTSTARPSVQVFGRDVYGAPLYIRFPALVTYLLEFDVLVDDELINNLKDSIGITNIKLSPSNPYALLVRDSNFIPSTIDVSLVTWKRALSDPGGPLTSLWSFTELAPFRWFKVNSYYRLSDTGYVTGGRGYNSQERYLVPQDPPELPLIFNKIVAWDLECYSKSLEFPSPDKIEDEIFMVSLVTNNASAILITTQPVDEGKIRGSDDIKNVDVTVVIVDDERTLIQTFMDYISDLQPDYLLSYNGDTFDIPYIIRRAEINGIVWSIIGKLAKVGTWIKRGSISGMFGMEWVPQLQVVGVEWLDLLHYYRRFSPELRNFRLNTVSNKVLGIGKTDMKISDLMNAVTNQDTEMLTLGGIYALVDSVRLMDLWDKDHLMEKFYKACNAIRILP